MSPAYFTRLEIANWMKQKMSLPARCGEARTAVTNKNPPYSQLRCPAVTGLIAILGRAGKGDAPNARIPVLAIPSYSLHGVTKGIDVYRIVGEGGPEAPVHLRTIVFELEGRRVWPFTIRQQDIFGLQLASSLSGLTSGLPQSVKLNPSETIDLTYFGQVPIEFTDSLDWLEKGETTRTRDISGTRYSSIGRLHIQLPVKREGRRILIDPAEILYPGTPSVEDTQPRELSAIELSPEMYEDKPILRIFGIAAKDGRRLLLSVFELTAQPGRLPMYQKVTLREWLGGRCLTRPDFFEMRRVRIINVDPAGNERFPGIRLQAGGKTRRMYTGQARGLKLPDGEDYVLIGPAKGDRKGACIYSFDSTAGKGGSFIPFETVNEGGGKKRFMDSSRPFGWFVRGKIALEDVPTLTRRIGEAEGTYFLIERKGKKLKVQLHNIQPGGVVHLSKNENGGIIVQTIEDGEMKTIKEVSSVPQEILKALPSTALLHRYRSLFVHILKTLIPIPVRHLDPEYVQIEPFEILRGGQQTAVRGIRIWAATREGQRTEDKPIKVLAWNSETQRLENLFPPQ